MSKLNQSYECVCGRMCLTEQQLKLHKAHCEESEGEVTQQDPVSEEQCAKWRQSLKQGVTMRVLISNHNYSDTTVRSHVRGDCRHGDSNLEYDINAKRWKEN